MLKRTKHKMPADIKSALATKNLLGEYKARPPYQQNDYIGWIIAAKLPETRAKRLQQMLHELEVGGIYMKMDHPPSAKNVSKKTR